MTVSSPGPRTPYITERTFGELGPGRATARCAEEGLVLFVEVVDIPGLTGLSDTEGGEESDENRT